MPENREVSVRQEDIGDAYYRRPDGTPLSGTRDIVALATVWTLGGLFVSAYAIQFWWAARQGTRGGVVDMGHGRYVYRVADPARFDAQIRLYQHDASYLGALAAVCIVTGLVLWIWERMQRAAS
ncbi:hypothetical protein [Paraburkholderia heleia]|uniref:hypothetical protein n=1 Tax=Paraburkholderia heleia TaxID=634127 RepID=UPI002AB70901|nr:hypothetical protein [Paraburkholderia heleia]